MFFMRIQSTKSTKSAKITKITKNTKRQASDFLVLRCFYAHKSTVFFVYIKSINANKRISDFLLFRCFLSFCMCAFCAFCACEMFS